jgi:hypothetical protein
LSQDDIFQEAESISSLVIPFQMSTFLQDIVQTNPYLNSIVKGKDQHSYLLDKIHCQMHLYIYRELKLILYTEDYHYFLQAIFRIYQAGQNNFLISSKKLTLENVFPYKSVWDHMVVAEDIITFADI